MGKATLVRKLEKGTGDQRLYRLSPPLAGYGEHEATHEFVVVSATCGPARHQSGPETYIFPADAEGYITDWGKLPGSFSGGLDHAEALRGAGYEEVVDG